MHSDLVKRRKKKVNYKKKRRGYTLTFNKNVEVDLRITFNDVFPPTKIMTSREMNIVNRKQKTKLKRKKL